FLHSTAGAPDLHSFPTRRSSDLEQARIAPDQPLVLLDHLRCAAFELPFLRGERFGPVDPQPWLEVLAESGVLHAEDGRWDWIAEDRKSTRLNSSHVKISYAVFCL